MSYLRSSEEMSEALGAPILLRMDPDPRFLERHDRLSHYAAETPHAGRFYYRLLEVLFGRKSGVNLGGQAVWVTGPWGSLEHLPWAVGLAEQAARAGERAYLAELDPRGVLRSMIPASQIPSEGTVPLAAARLGTWSAPVSVDLAGVRVLLTAEPGEAKAQPSAEEGRAWTLILADTLPESLEGPYPDPTGMRGVVLVAGFRDHTRHELEGSVTQLRKAGHRILGLIAIGPEGVVDLPEPKKPVRLKEEPKTPAPEPVPAPDVAVPEVPVPGVPVPGVPVPGVPVPGVPVPGVPVPEPGPQPPKPPAPSPEPPERKPGPKPPHPPKPIPQPPAAPPQPPAPPPAQPGDPQPPAPPPASMSGAPQRAKAEGPGVPSVQSVPLLTTWRKESARREKLKLLLRVVGVIAVTAATAGIIYMMFVRRLVTGPEPELAAGDSLTTPGPDTMSARPFEGAALTSGQVLGVMEEDTTLGANAAGGANETGAAKPTGATVEPGRASENPSLTAESGSPSESKSGSKSDSPSEWPASTPPNRPAEDVSGSTLPGQTTTSDLAARRDAIRPAALRDTLRILPADSTFRRPPDPTARFARPEGLRDSAGRAESESSPTTLGRSSRFVVHFSSFKDKPAADSAVTALRVQGLPARSLRVAVPGEGSWFRVIMGQYASVAAAESVGRVLLGTNKVLSVGVAGQGGRADPVRLEIPAGADTSGTIRGVDVVR